MKLNKYILSAAIAGMGLGVSSCGTEWLEITNNTQEPVEDYYTKESNIQQAIVAAYDPLHWFDYANNYCGINIYPEVIADQCFPGGGDVNDMNQWKTVFNFNTTPTIVLSTNYSNAYSGVKRCNDAIYYMYEYWKPATATELANRTYYEAQALALRAFFYNYLWHWWGNIAYYTTNLGGDYLAPQYTADEVYEFIMDDLEKVIEMNVLPEKCEGSELGRVTKHFVYMLYTEVVMYQNDQSRKQTALKYMEEIINSGKYQLMSDFAAIWDVTGEWCSESIFEINYSDYLASRNWSWGGTAGGTVVPCMILPRGYDSSDGIHDNTGWGFGTVRQSTYDSYEPNDTRRDASIWQPAPGSYKEGYQDTGLFLAKYAGKIGGNSGQIADAVLNYNNNLRLYRYSEALLNAAELGSPNAQTYLDMVRSRAGLASVPATLDNIIQERALEFLGEGKRYWDLIRTGLAKDYLVEDTDIVDGRTGHYTDNKKYLPFPQDEIDKCRGTLKQNDQYFQ
ncbi:MAG: RagB/SusD family nutrient uptake outer membrane protein [Muribaculaceae bacterium]|nr:RagB/SusD family nutrient uptake outer membrane protein [Muribaculaceae bacterium]MDE6755138.1 RagB/SusD family nutrient uptake outer membrane protein [Muribaculaceae bacterium]